ncbi:MAG: galactose mutarotase [Clostridia bacterium]|nr:galactose mutarotase [Clostridia bacterium]
MKKVLFGKLNGENVYKYSLTNGKISADILSYGATIQSLKTLDKNGNMIDVVLGFNSLEEYVKNEWYIGAVVGRVCNRIENGRFTLNGKQYQLSVNNPPNELHGGFNGFDKKIFKEISFSSEKLVLSTKSAHLEEGFPGNLDVSVTYSITEENGLKIEYSAVCDSDTIVSLTNHSYFNLDGEGTGEALDNLVKIESDTITPLNKNLVAYNEFMKIRNTPFDFTSFKTIRTDVDANNDIISFCGGFDINYVINGSGFRKFVTAKSQKTGIKLEGFTNQDGFQFYVGNFLRKCKGKTSDFDKRYGYCLETQCLPNAINCDKYPSPVLRKGEKYCKTTEFRFSVEK